jgi:hypothetical protein
MKRAYFDATGRLLILADLEGGDPGELAGAAYVEDLDFDVDVNTLYFEPSEGRVRTKGRAALAVNKDYILADGTDTATITGIPPGADVLLQGEAVKAAGLSLAITTTAPGRVEVALDTLRWVALPVAVEALDLAQAMAMVRAERDARLAASDWTDLPRARLTEDQRAAWTAYRDALFDLPDAQPAVTLSSVVWPLKPGAA